MTDIEEASDIRERLWRAIMATDEALPGLEPWEGYITWADTLLSVLAADGLTMTEQLDESLTAAVIEDALLDLDEKADTDRIWRAMDAKALGQAIAADLREHGFAVVRLEEA